MWVVIGTDNRMGKKRLIPLPLPTLLNIYISESVNRMEKKMNTALSSLLPTN